ncbi:hypothetical protein GH714_009068 [Hevea brasiliensis]|uniref:Retrotransposon gag domain-containing protein n=1 Tax=Hevea brasiliensis TaxID=3981 RepID=A0A6A6KJH3_HEVBR|nr:hypothetical protein GH714_008935 [Hevea brasiliensis]KAF2288604.1 hypothetical protein GH714_009068 [Hevea brasiliensis]
MHERNTRLGNLESRMLNLEAVASDMEDLAESLKSITISHNSLVGAVDDIKEDVKEIVKTIQVELHELKGKVNLPIRATSNPIMGSYKVSNTQIPELKAFRGVRYAKEVDNFLFDIELYFNATKNNSDERKLKMVPMYLTKDAKLWWHTKVEETISGQCSIASWDDFKKELKAQFYPENVAYNTRCKLNDLQQTCSIREYVIEFSTLMLNIKDMTGTYRLFNFLKAIREEEKGLKGKEQREDDSTSSMVGAIRFLGALKKQKHEPSTKKGLIYVDLRINGKTARALVETGATDNFITNTTVLQFKINMQEDTGKIKAVNSKATKLWSGSQSILSNGVLYGEIDFTVIPLDDFDVVIGWNF